MDDTISRQAAIDAIGGNEPVGDPSKMDDDDVIKIWERIRIINIINKLPSAQPERPEQPESAKEYCAECNHNEVCRWYPYEGCEFRSLPSAEPKRGEWEIINLGAVGAFDSCSECKRVVKHEAPFYNYCPNCGADMRGELNHDI